MKKIPSPISNAYRKYRAFSKRSKIYKFGKYSLAAIAATYGFILIFPQTLFAHEVSYKHFKVYSREPLDGSLYRVLDAAEIRLEKSPLYDENTTEKLFLSDTFPLYSFLNPRSGGSLANTTTGIGVITNKADVVNNLVFRNAEQDNKRSLSDVIAHEVTHLLIQNKLGLVKSFGLPRWKVEGYCEYVAGDTTIGFEEGSRRWEAIPNDDSTYLYFKYQQMAKYLLEDGKMSVEEFFDRDFDEKEIAAQAFSKINRK